MGAEDRSHVAAQLEVADRLEIRPLLLPDEEQGRSWPILPAQNRVASQRPDVERGIAEGECGGRIRRVWIHSEHALARARDGAHVLPINQEVERPWPGELLELR